jgi:hypothetical protein
MSALRWLSALCLAIALATGAAWWLQRQAAAELRTEIALAREDGRELVRLQAENGRIAASLPSDAELARMRADHAAIAELRSQLEQSKQSLQARERALAAPVPVAGTNRAAALGGGADQTTRLPPLTNAGRATPAAAAETAFWAAGKRDVDSLASLLTFAPAVRQDVEQLLASLPPGKRAEFGTPERLVAQSMLNIPLPVGLRVIDEKQIDPDHANLGVEMQSESGASGRTVPLSLERSPDGWRLLVPAGAIRDLARTLAPPSEARP